MSESTPVPPASVEHSEPSAAATTQKNADKPEKAKKEKPVKVGAGSEISNLQSMLLAKEKEIGSLYMHFDKQESKIGELNRENDHLKEQLKLTNDQNTLKQTIQALNEQLTKQFTLNRLQASQILDFEHRLWQAQKQRDEAEQALADF